MLVWTIFLLDKIRTNSGDSVGQDKVVQVHKIWNDIIQAVRWLCENEKKKR